MTYIKICLSALALALALSTVNSSVAAPLSAAYQSPLKFTEEVNKYLLQDKTAPVEENGVVITGSSSVRFWQSKMHQDFTQIKVIGRGFGGSNMNDLLHFSKELITQYKPRAVAIYEGDNDIGQGISPENIVSKYRQLSHKIKAELPNIRIYIISIKPSIFRQATWPIMAHTNSLMAAECNKDEYCTYIDVASSLLNDGVPKQDIFMPDNLHLNEKGYQLWSAAIVPIIEQGEKGL